MVPFVVLKSKVPTFTGASGIGILFVSVILEVKFKFLISSYGKIIKSSSKERNLEEYFIVILY
jgi:hypothetical protein